MLYLHFCLGRWSLIDEVKDLVERHLSLRGHLQVIPSASARRQADNCNTAAVERRHLQ